MSQRHFPTFSIHFNQIKQQKTNKRKKNEINKKTSGALHKSPPPILNSLYLKM